MLAKLILICIIYLVNEKDSTDYIIKEAISIVRKKGNENIDVKLTAFFSKSHSIPK